VNIVGDVPIYVHYDSADIWAHRPIFELDEEGRPTVVAGVPPDDFSKTGQLWGNPVYRWKSLLETDFGWWVERVRHNLSLFDVIRIDHFRGLVAYWEVPAAEKTAMNGRWRPVPTRRLLDRLVRMRPWLPVIAEDLGKITPSVRQVMRAYGLPGMKVLLFAFRKHHGTNPYLPHNVPQNAVIYTGTHDNNTARGWFEHELDPKTKAYLFRYLGRKVGASQIAGELMRLAMMSAAAAAIFPVQDLLGLGEEGRMNRPARPEQNWRWRLASGALTDREQRRLLEMTVTYGRG
jgi:4-alpha-glucanotransferase